MKRLILICAFVWVTGCSGQTDNPSTVPPPNSNPVGDGGLLSKQPCGPPCFHGLIPGSSTDEDAANAMNRLSNIFVACHVFDFTAQGGYRGANCEYVNLGYIEHRLYMVAFKPPTDVVVQQVIDLYGPPDLVSVQIISLPESPRKSAMTLFFDNIQSMLLLPNQDGDQFRIGPATNISYVAYRSAENYEEVRTGAIQKGVSWRGFGTYAALPSP